MAQIGFTHKTEPIYDRFQAMRREYEDKHGRTYAPDFLAVLMDNWGVIEECKRIVSAGNPFMVISFNSPPVEPQIVDIGALTMHAIDSATSEFIESLSPVSLHDYTANADANDPQFKTGWAGTDPDVFLRESGFRADLKQENEQ